MVMRECMHDAIGTGFLTDPSAFASYFICYTVVGAFETDRAGRRRQNVNHKRGVESAIEELLAQPK